MKKYYGGYEICEAMGYDPIDYTKITTLLNLIGAPMAITKKRTNAYCLTEKQVRFLAEKLDEMKEVSKI